MLLLSLLLRPPAGNAALTISVTVLAKLAGENVWGEVSVIIDTSIMAAENCAGVVINGVLCIGNTIKSGIRMFSASEGGKEDGPYMDAFML